MGVDDWGLGTCSPPVRKGEELKALGQQGPGEDRTRGDLP